MTYPPNESQPEWGTPQEPSGQRRVDPSAGGDDRALAVVAHLSPVIAAIVSAGWLSFVGPLVIWFIYKDRNALVRNAAASSFNFHITIWIAWMLAWVFFITLIGIPIAILLWVVPAIAQVVLSIIGALRAWNGEIYSYPFQIPILRT
ncbi:MAG TPA: DUF4870 domain-containing protein [Actinotalea caeni]|uniref:DUF4870 domain-containing protein n=1 Tax=Actinotalea caeni TaxID=1348467 RepID=UPI0012E20A5B|nr:DUF4870 domain-containing protein [Actinotalea caeni]HLV55361.1 DUF4870 domain-containing protein [Actinotalea caeni]